MERLSLYVLSRPDQGLLLSSFTWFGAKWRGGCGGLPGWHRDTRVQDAQQETSMGFCAVHASPSMTGDGICSSTSTSGSTHGKKDAACNTWSLCNFIPLKVSTW